MASPKSYKDPYWTGLASDVESRLELPRGLLSAIVTRGERSNADQVSEAGARTVFQIIPATRKAAIDKWGIDPMLSDENAAEVAGRLLKDSLQRNKGDAALAVAEYHGGTDRSNWGPRTRAYVQRVTGAAPAPTAAPQSTFERAMAATEPQSTGSIRAVAEAYQSGQMTPEDAAAFEKEVSAGRMLLPRGFELKTAAKAPAAPQNLAPPAMVQAYRSGQMPAEDRADFEALIQAGEFTLPPEAASQIPGQSVQAPPPDMPASVDPSLLDRARGAVETGLALATGATGGALGAVGGTLGATAAAIMQGQFGTAEANDMIRQAAAEGSQALTRAPRTAEGIRQTQAAGEVLSQIPPIIPVAGDLGAAARAAVPTARAVADVAAARAGQLARRAPPVAATAAAVPGAPAAPAPVPAVAPAVAPGRAVAGELPDVIDPISGQSISPSDPRYADVVASKGGAAPEAARVSAAAQGAPAAAAPPVAAPVAQAAPPVAAPTAILRDPVVRARPSDAAPDVTAIGKRDQVLDAIGIPQDQRRLGAQTGNRAQIQNEVMISKLEGADRMKQQFAMEADRLGDYAVGIQRDTGGTVGANPLQRGEAISAPLEGYQNWYNQQIKQLYQQADEAAAATGAQIRLNSLDQLLKTDSVFAGKAENGQIRRGLRAYLREQGQLDKMQLDATGAERLKQYLNSQWSPQTSGLIGKLKGAIDDDVLSVLPEDIYGPARGMRRQYAQIFEEPKGLAKILDISGPDGINRAISLDVLPDTMATWAARNSAQFRNVVGTLENLPTPELQAAGRQAIAEIRAHLVEKMLGRNIDSSEAALTGRTAWKGTDDSLSRAMAPYRGKLNDLLGQDLADRMETLKVGARILRPFDPNPSGTATTQLNLQSEMSKRAISTVAGAVGAAAGAATGGPMGAAGGAAGGAAAARKIIDVRQRRAIERATARALDASEKQKRIKELTKF